VSQELLNGVYLVIKNIPTLVDYAIGSPTQLCTYDIPLTHDPLFLWLIAYL
jgi:hypothetical protein